MPIDEPVPTTTPCLLKFPYEVSYIRRRGRKTTTTRLPGVVEVNFRTIGEAEAPVAFVVTPGDSEKKLSHFYVREFEGACWWPLSYDNDFVSIQRFIDALAAGDLRYLTLILESRIAHDYNFGHWTWRRFEDLNEREILSNNHDARLQLAMRNAGDFLCCGDRVFVRGLDPVYCCKVWDLEDFESEFAVNIADPHRRTLSVEYPQARPFGNGHDSFEICSQDGMVFRADEKEKLVNSLASRGLDVKFSADIEVVLPRNIRSIPLQIQVAAQLKAISRQIDLGPLPLESDDFRPLALAHARLCSVAGQERIDIDEGASALAALLVSRKRIALIREHDDKLSKQFADLQKPIQGLVKKVRAYCGSLRGSTSFLDKRDERALRNFGG